MKKYNIKKDVSNLKNDATELKDDAVKLMKESAEVVSDLAKEAKKKYDDADEVTKNKIKAGVMGAIGLLVAAVGARKIMGKGRNRKDED